MGLVKEGVLTFCLIGLGAFCAPLVSTHFAAQEKWSYHYLISLSIALTNTAVLIVAFRFKTQDGVFIAFYVASTF